MAPPPQPALVLVQEASDSEFVVVRREKGCLAVAPGSSAEPALDSVLEPEPALASGTLCTVGSTERVPCPVQLLARSAPQHLEQLLPALEPEPEPEPEPERHASDAR